MCWGFYGDTDWDNPKGEQLLTKVSDYLSADPAMYYNYAYGVIGQGKVTNTCTWTTIVLDDPG